MVLLKALRNPHLTSSVFMPKSSFEFSPLQIHFPFFLGFTGPVSSREGLGVGPSSFKILPRQSHRDVVPSLSIDLEESTNPGTPQPLRIRTEEHVCTLNRNPADFSIPDARNQYTICAKDLKLKKRNASKERSSSGNREGRKRQRVTKNGLRKESARK